MATPSLRALEPGKLVTVWHKGFLDWEGILESFLPQASQKLSQTQQNAGGFTKNELMSFSVTPTGNDWATGYNMWDTLTDIRKTIIC